MKVRACEPADLVAVQAIYAHHVLNGFGTFEEEPPPLEEMRRRYDTLLAAHFPFLVAEVDGEVAGYAYAGPFRARSAYRHTCENSVYIAPALQRRGAGHALMHVLIEECRRRGLKQMLAVIGDSANHGSIGLHTRLGFRPVGVFKDVGYKLGRWVDVVMMQLTLGDPAP